MTDSDINEFKSYVLQVLMEKYYLSKDESQQAINNSYLSKVLKSNDDFIFFMTALKNVQNVFTKK